MSNLDIRPGSSVHYARCEECFKLIPVNRNVEKKGLLICHVCGTAYAIHKKSIFISAGWLKSAIR